MEVDIGMGRVTLSCSNSPVRGGGTLTITLFDDWGLGDPHTQLLLKFVGSSLERNIIATVVTPRIACIDIPAWERPEEVIVQISLSKTVPAIDGHLCFVETAVAVLPFSYCSDLVHDAAFHLLTNADRENHLCDIKSLEHLSLLRNDPLKLDLPLTHAFTQLSIPEGCNVLRMQPEAVYDIAQEVNSICERLQTESWQRTGSSYDHVPLLTECDEQTKARFAAAAPPSADTEGRTETVIVAGHVDDTIIHLEEPLSRAISELQASIRDIEDYKYKVSDAQVQRKGQLSRYSSSCPSLDGSWAEGAVHGRYRSMLTATKEEDEDFAPPTDSPKFRGEFSRGHERPRSLDSLGLTLRGSKVVTGITLSGVTQDSSSVGAGGDSSNNGNNGEAAADQLRQVSRSMYGGAPQQKSIFHNEMVTAEGRSFSLGRLGSGDESEGYHGESSTDADVDRTKNSHPYQDAFQLRRADDLSVSALQARPQSYGGLGTKLLLSRNSSEQSAKLDSSDLSASIMRTRASTTLLTSSTNLNKSKSVSTPSIRGDLSSDHPRLFTEGSLSNCEALAEEDINAPPRYHLAARRSSLLTYPMSFPDEEDIRKKQSSTRRLSLALSKLGSQRKSKDMKKSLHNFVPILSAPSTCDVCGRYLNSSKAVQCSNCLVNIHDECREKVSPCAKTKTSRKTSRPPVLVSSLAAATISNVQETNSASMESLVDCSYEDFEEDPELLGTCPEPESWSVTVDKKLLKKLNAKYIQRQDNIFEFIATERQYLRTLKMMQKVFVNGMIKRCKYSKNEVDKFFPGIVNLVDVHRIFLSRLQSRQDEKADKSVDVIGDVILQQFDDHMGDRMKEVYGRFVSRQREAVEHYKNKMKTDRMFQEFIKNCSANPNTRRRGVQDLITIVTQRMTKYKTLLEQIIKNTKDAKDKCDKENLTNALECNKRILEHIDEAIETRTKELRLIEIYTRMDVRATATYDGIKTFRKSDFLAKGRKLRHEGIVAWRNAREKEVETLVVLLSDVVVFLQDSPQKYAFFSQDSKASVHPLSKLLVREKGSTKDNRGIYLIRQSPDPEMIELVCRSANEQQQWIRELRKATRECPEEDESAAIETAEEGREALEKLAKVNELVESLKAKDDELEALCRQRFHLLSDLFTVYGQADICDQIQSGYNEDGEFVQAIDLIKFALTEVSRLSSTYMTLPPLSPTGSALGRSWSSVGEHQTPGNSAPLIPKRSDTFGGFEQGGKSIATGSLVRQKGTASQSSLQGGGSASSQELSSHDSDSGVKEIHGVDSRDSGSGVKSILPATGQLPGDRSSASLMQAMTASGSTGSSQQIDLAGLTMSAGHGETLVALSNIASVTALIAPSREQLMCLGQLSEYLQALLLITNKQDTTIESYKQQLAEALLRMNKLNQEVEKVLTEKRSAFRHNKQMEEIRNLHELVSKERQQMEADKDKWRHRQNEEQQRLDELRLECEHQQEELRREREDLQRQRKAMEKQIDFYGVVQGRQSNPSVTRSSNPTALNRPFEAGTSDNIVNKSGLPPSAILSSDGGLGSNTSSIVHLRSRSADIPGQGTAAAAGGYQSTALPYGETPSLVASMGDMLLSGSVKASTVDVTTSPKERSLLPGSSHAQPHAGVATRPRSAQSTGVSSGRYQHPGIAGVLPAPVPSMSAAGQQAVQMKPASGSVQPAPEARHSAAANPDGSVAKSLPNRSSSSTSQSKQDDQDVIYF